MEYVCREREKKKKRTLFKLVVEEFGSKFGFILNIELKLVVKRNI